MDINARINWKPGMEFTAQTMSTIADNLNFRQQVALRAALGANRMGRLPEMPFECRGVFVKNKYEVDQFKCMVVLPSGRIVHADEDLAINIPMLFGDRYYLTVGISDEVKEFEKEDVPFKRPIYSFGIHTKEEVEQEDLFPLIRFDAKEGTISVNTDFIAPCLLLSTDEKFGTYLQQYIEGIEKLSVHSNLAEGDGKRAMLRYLFRLKGYNTKGSVHDFVMLMQEIAQAIDYFIVTPNMSQPTPIMEPSDVDIQEWLKWMVNYISGAAEILDGVVLEDNTIDYEALLAQAKAELYDRLHPELIEKLIADMREELHAEIQKQTEDITNYIQGTLKPELERVMADNIEEKVNQLSETMKQQFEQLSYELEPKLHDRLYEELYESLYKALYVPDPEEAAFVPII